MYPVLRCLESENNESLCKTIEEFLPKYQKAWTQYYGLFIKWYSDKILLHQFFLKNLQKIMKYYLINCKLFYKKLSNLLIL